jgi:hypothetical protein
VGVARRWSVLLAYVLCMGRAATLAAQQSAMELVRGRVQDDSARALVGASVKVTRGPDRLTLDATTDSVGAYRVRFDVGTGDYLVYVSAPGFRTARRRVQRQEGGTEPELVADFVLARDLTVLAAVKVTADKPERASNDVGWAVPEPGAADRWTAGVNGQLPPTVAGSLDALASTFSNIAITANGPSVAGSGSESNLTTLNGVGLAAGSIPRAAQTQTRVTGATFDPTRGGFAGTNIDVRLDAGSREYQERRAFITFDPQGFQFADPASSSLGARRGGFRASVGADGEILRDALTYNVALDVARSTSDPVTLLTASPDLLRGATISADSVARLVAIAGRLGLPFTGRGVPENQRQDVLTWLARLDDTRDTLRTRALTTYAELRRDGGSGLGLLATPSTAAERRGDTYGAQLLVDEYVGPMRRVLNETRLAGSVARTATLPYVALPRASVLVRSAGLDPTADVAEVFVGGAASPSTSESRWTAEAGNETDWNAGGHRHRFKALLWGRTDGVRQDGTINGLGSFSYNSIGDLEANHPSAFMRTLSEPARSGTVWNAASALAHQYAPTRYFSVLYGARLDADGFVERPPANPLLDQTLGIRSGAAPTRLHVSPRLGFTYTYNRDRTNGNSMMVNELGRFTRGVTGTIRGGIGDFRDLLRPGLLADASAAAGLPGGYALLSCVGSATPAADWSAFTGVQAVPSQCADGSGVLGEQAPSVRLIDPAYDVPHSWRASLEWDTSVGSWLFHAAGLASLDLSQSGMVDANFSGTERFQLPAEGNRPVYVSTAAIDPASGAVAPTEARKSNLFGSVTARVSDLRGHGGQLTFGAAPGMFRFGDGMTLMTSASYTLQESRRQYRGFDGASFGDPRSIEWSVNGNDVRHVLVVSGGLAAPKLGVVTFFVRMQSGLPFTPLVGGDVNGDGRSGDRAFIPDPTTAPSSDLARQLSALLASGSPTARRCLTANLGHVPDRNGCRSPWSQSINMQWSVPTPSRWSGRAHPTIYLQNLAAGVDQALHGSDLRGWGLPAAPDPVLLVPRTFDPAGPAFAYDVNPRFAETRPGRSLALNPFRIVIDVSLDLSVDYDLQRLRRAVEPVRRPTGYERRSADSLTAFYLARTSDLYRLLLSQSDSLLLSAQQTVALQRADSVYSARVRAAYVPLGQFLARGQGGAGPAEVDSVRATEKSYWKIFWEQPEIADSIVTPSQRELMPVFKTMLGVPARSREQSRFGFGNPVVFADRPRQNR